MTDPSPILPLLERLRDDPEQYVRRSVANNLNDISKDHPGLVVEIAESSVLSQAGTAQERLQALRDAGVRISIDDFGSGYSNLGQLLRVPFDVIKIDRSLLLTLSEMRERAGGDTSGPCAIMETIVSIAHVLQAPVLCEGVDTDAQRESLRASGITYVQGYLTGPPMRPEQLQPPCHGADAKVNASLPV